MLLCYVLQILFSAVRVRGSCSCFVNVGLLLWLCYGAGALSCVWVVMICYDLRCCVVVFDMLRFRVRGCVLSHEVRVLISMRDPLPAVARCLLCDVPRGVALFSLICLLIYCVCC